MRKRDTTYNQVEEKTLNKQKLQKINASQNEEIYSYQNGFRTFDTPFISAFCLHSTEPLIAVSSSLFSYQRLHGVFIYTLDGDLVTCFEASVPERIYLSATMMITLNNSTKTLTKYNDFCVKDVRLYLSCFDCNTNGDIYAVPFPTMECDVNTNIEIYSPDLKYVKSLEVEGFDNILSFRIQGDYIAFLNYSSMSRYTVSRYSLSKDEHVQTVVIDRSYLVSHIVHLSFDPLSNIIISCYGFDKFAVWYFGGKVRYYKPKGRSVFKGSYAIGQDITSNFELIRAMTNGSIRIYDGIPVTL